MSERISSQRPRLFPLEHGDHLSRAEFERRYMAMPHLKKAELLEGVVYLPSPVRFTVHGQPHAHLITWLGFYQAFTPGLAFGDNSTVRLPGDNEPQPDLLLMIPHNRGGQARIDEDDYVEGAPELAAEVAASSASYDLHAKMRVYRHIKFASTLSGVSLTKRSTGSSYAARNTNHWHPAKMTSFAAKSFLACGSTPKR